MEGILGITGTPGTGKKSVAPQAAKLLGVEAQDLNDLARSHGLLRMPADDEVVNTDSIRKKLKDKIPAPNVIYGHLLPYVLSAGSITRVVVLRCEPAVLKQRLALRGYATRKLLDNVEAELIGLLSSDSFDTFGETKTFELDTTYSTPLESARSIVALMRGERTSDARIDWTLNYDTGLKLRSLLTV